MSIQPLFSQIVVSKTSLRFGWSAAKPPQSAIALKKRDFDSFKQLQPKPQWVERVADQLMVMPSDEQPRIAYVPQIGELLGSWENVRIFQENLIQKIGEVLGRRKPEVFLQPQFYPARSILLSPEQIEVDLNTDDFDGVNKNLADWNETGTKQLVYSTKAWHSDQSWHQIASLSYGPTVNIEGGDLQVMDARQLARDKGLTLEEVFNKNYLKAGEGLDLLAKYEDKHRDPYVLTLPKEGLVIFNNMNDAGILHRPSPIRLINPKRPAQRPIHYVSYKVKAKK